jgi:Ca2+-binding EF-hand superfamily protein
MSGWYDPGDVAFGGAARESGGAEGVDGAESVEGAARAARVARAARESAPGAGVRRGGTWDTGYMEALGSAGSARSSASAGSFGSLPRRVGVHTGVYSASGTPSAPESFYAPASYYMPASYLAPTNVSDGSVNQLYSSASQDYAPASQYYTPASESYAPAGELYAPASEWYAPAPSPASGSAAPSSARERSVSYGDGGKDSGDRRDAPAAPSGSARAKSSTLSGSSNPTPEGIARSKTGLYSGGSLQHTFQDHAAELLPVCRKFHLHARHVREFQALFKQLDINKSGTVERAELFALLQEPLTLFSDAIFDLVQCSSEGGLRLSEFIEALSTFALLGKEDILRFCFFALDRDKSGFLDHRELHLLCELLHGRPGERVPNIELVLTGFDRDRDGRISFSEFVKINKRFPLLLWPAFRLQARIEEAIMGRDWWYRHRRYVAVERRRAKEDPAAAARADATAVQAAYGSVAGSASRAASRALSASRKQSDAKAFSSSTDSSLSSSSSSPSSRLARQVAATFDGGDATANAVRSLSATPSDGSRALSDDFIKAWGSWKRVGNNRVFPDRPGAAPEPDDDGGERARSLGGSAERAL